MAAQDHLLHSPQAEQILKNKEKVLDLMHSSDAQRLMSLLRQTGGAGLQQAAQSAMEGNPEQLMQIMQQVMSNPEGAKTMERIQRNLPK